METFTTTSEPRNVRAKLNYYLPASQGGVDVFYAGTAGDKRKKRDERVMPISDIRGREKEFKIDRQGFQLLKIETEEKTFDDDERVKEVYYQDVIEAVKRATGATKVVPVNHVVRRQSWEDAMEEEKNLDDMARSAYPSTAHFVHVDQSTSGAWLRASQSVPEHMEKNRWAIMNLWKPIATVTRDALAVCDYRSVSPSDLIDIPAIFPTRSQEEDGLKNKMPNKDPYLVRNRDGNFSNRANLWMVWHNDRHRWYYCSEMKPEEGLLLKMYDTKDGVARFVPHTAFACDQDYGPARQSLEVRMLLVWENEPPNGASSRL